MNILLRLLFISVFPELEDISLCDMAEGAMEYEGRLDANELVNKLKQMGFNAEIA